MNSADEYARRRQDFMKQIGDGAVAVFHSPPERLRNGDAFYRFRQSSDLHYLCGFEEPEATLVVKPGASKTQVVLFVRPRDKEREVWDGLRAGVDGAMANFGADVAYPISELDRKLPELISGADRLFYSLGHDPDQDRKMVEIFATLRRGERRGKRTPKEIVDPRMSLHEQRLIKSEFELRQMRVAAKVSAHAHTLAMAAATPGRREFEIEALINYVFRSQGASGPGYESIVGGGTNATILHYIENSAELKDGDLLLIDAGCEFQHYTADITRTFPVSGTFSAAQKSVYEAVLDVQESAIAACKPGETLDGIHEMCIKQLCSHMVELGLLQGSVDENIQSGAYRRFYMHRTSHWLGMDVHDVGSYFEGDKPRPLEAGMVLTVEPGMYIAADDETVALEFRGIGIRIEDDILVTTQGPDNLTSDAPKSVAEVESACQIDFAGFPSSNV